MIPERPCDACGVKLIFVRGPNGNVLPLQLVKNAYVVDRNVESFGGSGEPKAVKVEVEPASAAIFVSHFETCTNPSRFSKKGKR